MKNRQILRVSLLLPSTLEVKIAMGADPPTHLNSGTWSDPDWARDLRRPQPPEGGKGSVGYFDPPLPASTEGPFFVASCPASDG